MTTATATKTAIDEVLEGVYWPSIRSRFHTFGKFRTAVLAALPTDDRTTVAYAEDVLDTAAASQGNLALRISYAAHLVRHGCDNPLER